MENANFYMCDKTASVKFSKVFQLVTSCLTHVQKNRIENSVFDTVSKNFVILTIFNKNLHIFVGSSQLVLKSIRTQVNSFSVWSIRTHDFGQFVLNWLICTHCLVNSYSIWSVRTHFGQLVLVSVNSFWTVLFPSFGDSNIISNNKIQRNQIFWTFVVFLDFFSEECIQALKIS